MIIHKLILDDVFEEVAYTLIAIHCSLEDYRLAFLLNKHLGITLTRKSLDLDYNNEKLRYSIFEWEDNKQLTNWSLISNICKTKSDQKINYPSLFDVKEKIIKTNHLIPEYKRVDYFLKIDNEYNFSKEKYILDSLLKIPQITTAYRIDASQLKSKDNLIF